MHRVGYCTPNIHYHPESMTFGNRVLEDVITDEVILDDSWPYSTPNSAVLLGKKKKKKGHRDSHTGGTPGENRS